MKLQQTAIKRRRPGGKLTRAAALCLLALAAVALRAGEARAQWTTSGTNTTTTNNVGVGTGAPSATLEVVGAPGAANNTNATAPDALKVTGGLGGNGNWSGGPGGVGGSLTFAGGTGGAPASGSQSAIGGKGGSINLSGGTGGANVFSVGGGTGGDVVINGGAGVANSNGNVILGNLRGNVGVGTSNPGYHLHVYNNLNSEVFGTVENANAGATAAASIMAKTNNGYAYLKMGSTAYGSWGAVGTTGTGSFYYDVFNGAGDHVWRTTAAASERMRLTNAGNVGIGTNAPATKLHVVGDVTVTGNINAKWQDVAEWVPSTQKLSAGTVVVLDTRNSNHVLASTTSYDARVAGVISAQPGLTLGEAGEGKALVATTGRVKVKVDATRAPVQIGDLLVTSDVEGVAMKSEPINIGGRQIHSPGTIIGKALEPLEKGTGEILVLLSLQ
ncbi:MAG: hypothetical protein QOH49_3701 [Acidobacteriota bacterium]|jgi:hypothetical protein|nr:hypothetical protein [Acidobacteriota bacterium]